MRCDIIAVILAALCWGSMGTNLAQVIDEASDDRLDEGAALSREGRHAWQAAKEALQAAEDRYGPTHPRVAQALTRLAEIEIARRHLEAALPLLQRALRIDEQTLHHTFPHTTEAEKVSFLHTADHRIELLLKARGSQTKNTPEPKEADIAPSTLEPSRSLPNDPTAVTIMTTSFEWRLWLDYALERERQAWWESEEAQVTAMADKFRATVSQLGSLRRAGPEGWELEAYRRQVADLEAEAARLEEAMAKRDTVYAALRHSRRQVDDERLANLLWPGRPPAEIVFVLTAFYRLTAALYRSQGKYDAAIALYDRLLAKYDHTFGPEDPLLAPWLAMLAELEIARGHPQAALSLLQRAVDLDARALATVLAISRSELEQRAFLRMLDYRFALLLSLVAQHLATDPAAVRTALDATLRRKSVILDTLLHERRILAAADDPEVADLAAQRQSIMARLTALRLTRSSGLPRDIYHSRLATLDAERQRLEAQLADRSESYATVWRARQPVDAERLAQALAPGSALVEYVLFQRVDFEATERLAQAAAGSYALMHMVDFQTVPGPWRVEVPWYLALVLPEAQTAQPVLVDLGNAEEVDEAVRAFRQKIVEASDAIQRMGEATAERRLRGTAERLKQRIFAPVQAAMGGRTTLYLSLDGTLNFIPLEALPGEPGRYLVETYQFHYLSSGRDVMRVEPAPPPGHGVVVVADPDYDWSPPDNETEERPPWARGPISAAPIRWTRLPGTRQEATAIMRALNGQQVILYQGAEALEATLKGLKSPRVLHLATHGFFHDTPVTGLPAAEVGPPPNPPSNRQASPFRAPRPPPEDEARFPRHLGTGGAEARRMPSYLLWPTLEYALLGSGIVLAGANHHNGQPSGALADDGIMTALEASELRLLGTEVVVLSACDTGAGEASQGEGVFGLRRAFQLAGARMVVMSLWPIPDAETAEFMASFYGRINGGAGVSQALREAAIAQLQARRQRSGAAHPLFWGAFIALGHPGAR